MLEVRILPGEPNLFDLKKLQSLGRAFGSRPNAWHVKMKIDGRKLLREKGLLGSVPRVKKRRHKNVILMVVNGGKMRTKGE